MIEYRVVSRWEREGTQSNWRTQDITAVDEEGRANAQIIHDLLLTPPTVVADCRIEQREVGDWSPVA